MKVIRTLGAVFDNAVNNFTGLAGVLLIFVMLVVCAEIVLRYFFHSPTLWVLEISEVLLLYITFLGTAWLLRREGHVKIDMLLTRLPLRTQALLNITTSTIGAIMWLALTWYGIVVTLDLFQRGISTPTVLHLPRFAIILIIPVGSLMLAIQFLRRAGGYWKTWRPPEKKEIQISL